MVKIWTVNLYLYMKFVVFTLQPISILSELIRDNFRTSKVKVAILPALGELLYLIAAQEDIKERPVLGWTVSAVTYTMLTRLAAFSCISVLV